MQYATNQRTTFFEIGIYADIYFFSASGQNILVARVADLLQNNALKQRVKIPSADKARKIL